MKCLVAVLAKIALLLICLSVPCLAHDGSTATIDNYIQSELQKQGIPGISLAVIKNGRIILAKGYGLANVEHQVQVKLRLFFSRAQ